jgi:hypothetical protein
MIYFGCPAVRLYKGSPTLYLYLIVAVPFHLPLLYLPNLSSPELHPNKKKKNEKKKTNKEGKR